MKYDKRRKYFCIIDTETTSLPETKLYPENFALTKPLVYDLGYCIVDKKGNVYEKKNFVVSEIFFNAPLLNTAYYSNKKPLYLDKLSKNEEITALTWNEIMRTLANDLQKCCAIGAYNATFDMRAINYTTEYIENFYNGNFEQWYSKELETMEYLANNTVKSKKKQNKKIPVFTINKKEFTSFDVWTMVCKTLNKKYKDFCTNNNYLTKTGYCSTSAETTYRFFTNNKNFVESHTALDDSIIESFLFSQAVKRNKNKVDYEIESFPFKIIGKVE